jgi:hypothetical protein
LDHRTWRVQLEDGLLLLDAESGTCGVVFNPAWIWLPQQGEARGWTPDMVYPNGALVPGRKELVYLASVQTGKDSRGELRRCDALDGTLRAAVPVAYWWLDGIAFVAGQLIDARSDKDGDVLELRRIDDLVVMATAKPPQTAYGRVEFRAAAHASRIAFSVGDAIEVYEVKLPEQAGK